MKTDILVFAAHPDDAELSCAGTIAAHVAMRHKVAVVDLTRGEMGTRGTPEIRAEEAAHSTEILGLSARENLNFKDVYFEHDHAHMLEVVRMIRKYQPEIVLANAVEDRHPDHGKAARLVREAIFLSGLSKIETEMDGVSQQPWRPSRLLHYIQSVYIKPDIIFDISEHMEKKMESVQAFKSQFYNKDSNEPETYISTIGFMEFITSRAREMGQAIGVNYGEGFTVDRTMGIKDLTQLL